MKLAGYKSPGRKATSEKLRALSAPVVAKNCPEIFACDKEFMRLFRASKRIEGMRGQRAKFLILKNRLRNRGIYLESLAKKAEAA